jgi:hypothetical protein
MTWGHLGLTRCYRARVLQALIVAVLWCASSLGHAQHAERAGLGLNWVRLPGAQACIASVDLMNRIEERVGRIIFVRTGEAVLTLDGYVRPASPPDGWLVTFEISDAKGKVLGRRELGKLEGTNCKVVADAAELIVDLMLDPEGLLGAGIPLEPATQRQLDELLRGEPSELDPATLPSATSMEAKTSPRPASSLEPAAPAMPSAADDTRRDDVALDIAGVAMLGTLPELAPGVALNLSIGAGDGWALELGLLTLAERDVETPPRDQGRASFGYQALSLALCPPRFIPLVDLCGGAEYGRQAVSTTGFRSAREVQSREAIQLVAHATLRVELFAALFLRVSATLLVPLVRHDYVYDSRIGDLRVFRTAPIAGRTELGLGLYI